MDHIRETEFSSLDIPWVIYTLIWKRNNKGLNKDSDSGLQQTSTSWACCLSLLGTFGTLEIVIPQITLYTKFCLLEAGGSVVVL